MERYYLGLRAPSPLNEHIRAMQQELFDSATTVEPLDPHLTLVPPPRLARLPSAEIAPHARAAAAQFLPLELRIEGTKVFQEHVFVLSISGKGLQPLRDNLETFIPAEASSPRWQPHPFSPHITISETIGGAPLQADRLAAYERAFQPLIGWRFIVDNLTLYRWLGPRRYQLEDL